MLFFLVMHRRRLLSRPISAIICKGASANHDPVQFTVQTISGFQSGPVSD